MTGRQNLQVRVTNCLEDLDGLVPEWELLLAGFPGASIFSTCDWLVSWWRTMGSGHKLLVLAFYDSNSRLVGLAPLTSHDRKIAGMTLPVVALMGDGSGDSDNLDFPVLPGYEDDFAYALLDYLEIHATHWHCCEFNTIPANSLSAYAVEKELERRGWTYVKHLMPCSAVALPDSWESYLKQLSSKERGKINYLSRRLQQKHAVRYYKCMKTDELKPCLEHLFRLHQQRWELQGQLGSFRCVARRHFYIDLSERLLKRGQLEFWLLDLDGKTVAALIGFRYLDTVYALQEGFDPSYQADSVGYVLRAYVLGQLIDSGVRRYDFLAGRDPSKIRWGAEVGNYLDMQFARPRSLGSFFLHAVEVGKRTKELLRARLPRPIWDLLHRINILLLTTKRHEADTGHGRSES